MKSAKKILALILAGVMALALLTGCGKSLNRTMAEGVAEYLIADKGLNNNISVSYQVPELSRDIAPLFDENWIRHDDRTGSDFLNGNYSVNGKTVTETLTDILSPYNSAPSVLFRVADVTDVKTPFMEGAYLINSMIVFGIEDSSTFDPTSITSMKIAVTHKTVNGHTYALAVMILEK